MTFPRYFNRIWWIEVESERSTFIFVYPPPAKTSCRKWLGIKSLNSKDKARSATTLGCANENTGSLCGIWLSSTPRNAQRYLLAMNYCSSFIYPFVFPPLMTRFGLRHAKLNGRNPSSGQYVWQWAVARGFTCITPIYKYCSGNS